MTGRNPRFETYFARERQWKAEFNALREILLDCQLTEELKWRQPCYTFEGENIVILSGYKAGATLGFFKGSLMPDPDGVLIVPGPNSQAARMLRFADVAEIKKRRAQIARYVQAAITVAKSGAKVDFSANKAVKPPAELEAALKTDADLKKAFEALTPGRQRSWIIHIEAAKLPTTRVERITKARPRIMQGEGMHDGYRKGRA
jgi:uncharacterized protein YdeI (YjbR/CyaY-like superfamily)